MAKAKKQIPIWWMPQEGPQTWAAVCPVEEIGMFGNRFGGKTQTAMGRQLRGAAKWGSEWNGLMFRKKYKSLAGLRRAFDKSIMDGTPAERIGGDRESNYVRFKNKATITLAAIPDLKTAADYQGHGYTEISIEEAPEYAFISELVDVLHGALRADVGAVPTHMFMNGNPGGPGAAQIKSMFMLDENGNPRPPLEVFKVSGISRVYIPSDIRDNKIGLKNNPGYLNWLMSIKDPVLRAAWYKGSFDRVIGQAFFLSPQNIIDPIPVPQYAPLIMAFDWGWGAPFSVQWFWVDGEGRLYLFNEWYGCEGINRPNIGLRMTDPQIAYGILEREKQMGILGRPIMRLAGHDCVNRKPNYQEGIQGPSTLEEFVKVANNPKTRQEFGENVHLNLVTMKPDKLAKLKQFRERLRVPTDENGKVSGIPMLVVYNTCTHFKRIIPTLSMNDTNHEQLEEHQEDHVYDSCCLACMSRQIGITDHDLQRFKTRDKKGPKLDSITEDANREYRELIERIANQDNWDETDCVGLPM